MINTWLKCTKCGWVGDLSVYHYKCPRCGGPLDIEYEKPPLSKRVLDRSGKTGIIRYKRILPPLKRYISLGEGGGLVRYLDEFKTYFALEHLNPSGSFKDRGAAYTVSYLASYFPSIKDIVEDSSGNAGISFTLYGKTADFNIHIFIPRDAPRGKVRYMKLLGGIVHKAPNRDEANRMALEYARDKIYVGHLYNPFFIKGLETLSYDLYRVLNDVDHIFIPFGSGTLFLGLYNGYLNLYEDGLVDKKPVLHVVEAEGYEKISRRRKIKKSRYLDGIKVSVIPRINEIRSILSKNKWLGHVINDFKTVSALKKLIKLGFIVEPTSAASYAALIDSMERGDIGRGEKSLIILTGSGLKMIDDILKMFREFNLYNHSSV